MSLRHAWVSLCLDSGTVSCSLYASAVPFAGCYTASEAASCRDASNLGVVSGGVVRIWCRETGQEVLRRVERMPA